MVLKQQFPKVITTFGNVALEMGVISLTKHPDSEVLSHSLERASDLEGGSGEPSNLNQPPPWEASSIRLVDL